MTKKSKIKERNIRESANNKIFGDPIPKHRKRNQSGIRRVSIEGKYHTALVVNGKIDQTYEPIPWTKTSRNTFKSQTLKLFHEPKYKIPKRKWGKEYIEEVIENQNGHKVYLRYGNKKQRTTILKTLYEQEGAKYETVTYKTIKSPHVKKYQMNTLREMAKKNV